MMQPYENRFDQGSRANGQEIEDGIQMYKLLAITFLFSEGEFKGHLETVTFVAASEAKSHQWPSMWVHLNQISARLYQALSNSECSSGAFPSERFSDSDVEGMRTKSTGGEWGIRSEPSCQPLRINELVDKSRYSSGFRASLHMSDDTR
jgi:hypothetical protein